MGKINYLLTGVVLFVPVVPHTSCRNRCYEPYDGDVPGCRCDENCVTSNSCCYDYHDICANPGESVVLRFLWQRAMLELTSEGHRVTCLSLMSGRVCLPSAQQWECTKLRCGEKRLAQSKCRCSDDCLSAADCCTNYKQVCQGEKNSTAV